MSYNVVILLSPVPQSDAEAWDFMAEQVEKNDLGEIPITFHTLVDRLTAKFPCVSDLPEDQKELAAWSDGPLIGNAGHVMIVLGLAERRVGEVLPFVLKAANRLGLVVFDGQTESIHRPIAGPLVAEPTNAKPLNAKPNVKRTDFLRAIRLDQPPIRVTLAVLF